MKSSVQRAKPAIATSLDLPAAGKLARMVFHAAWLAIVVGLAAQICVLILKSVWTADPGTVSKFCSELTQKVSWSILVCIGLALGTVANSSRSITTGVIGLLAAPLAITVARATQKSVAQLLGVPVDNPPMALTITLCFVKGLEYLALGCALGWLSKHAKFGAKWYAAIGLAAGALFGPALLVFVVLIAPKTPPTVELTARLLNELIQPIGCALVYFSAERLAKLFAPFATLATK